MGEWPSGDRTASLLKVPPPQETPNTVNFSATPQTKKPFLMQTGTVAYTVGGNRGTPTSIETPDFFIFCDLVE